MPPAPIQSIPTWHKPLIPDKSWLQVLINNPPGLSCDIAWKRSCPGAVAQMEGGMDLTSPSGTPVYALADGLVVGAGYFYHPDGTQ